MSEKKPDQWEKPLGILDQTAESTDKVLNDLGEVPACLLAMVVKAPNRLLHAMVHAFGNLLKQNGVVRRVYFVAVGGDFTDRVAIR